MSCPGDEIVALMGTATETALVIAPFIRSRALEDVLEAIPDGVDISVVTRWRPSDLLSGASDLGVYDVTASRDIALYLRYDLHAKLYVADNACLIGSANVTETALGWRDPSNLELLTPVDRNTSEVRAFEAELFRVAVRATPAQGDFMQRFVDDLASVVPRQSDPEVATDDLAIEQLPSHWIPRSKNPEDLYAAYVGNTDIVGRVRLHDMQVELEQFGVPPGLTEPHFNSWICAAIIQSPVAAGVLRSIDETGGISEIELAALLDAVGGARDKSKPAEMLEVLRRWFNYFMSGGYETKQDSIRLIRATKL